MTIVYGSMSIEYDYSIWEYEYRIWRLLRSDCMGEVGGWGRDPFSRNFMKPTPRRKWYLTTGRRFH